MVACPGPAWDLITTHSKEPWQPDADPQAIPQLECDTCLMAITMFNQFLLMYLRIVSESNLKGNSHRLRVEWKMICMDALSMVGYHGDHDDDREIRMRTRMRLFWFVATMNGLGSRYHDREDIYITLFGYYYLRFLSVKSLISSVIL